VEAPRGLQRRITVRVPSAQIDREVRLRLTQVGKTAKLKGFRPGKIPAKVVHERYGGQVRQEVITDVIRASYSQALSQEKLRPAGGPSIEPLTDEREEHFSYQATFEVYPEIALKPIEALTIERPVVELKESDVEAMVEKLRDQRADWQVVNRAAMAGDRVVVDFVGKIAKEPFEGGEGTEVPIIVGAGQVIEGFDKALKGVSAEQSKSAKVKFPKDYQVEELAGKKAVFDIKVHRVEEKLLLEIDDAFLEAFGVKEGGIEALRSEVRGNLQRELRERITAVIKGRALDALLQANDIQVPQSLVEEQAGAMQAESMRRFGIEDPDQAPPKANFEEPARRRIAVGLLVQELIPKHGIELDSARVNQRIQELVAPYEKPEETAQIYRANRELMAQVESAVLEEQVVEFLLEHAKTKDKVVEFQEFMA